MSEYTLNDMKFNPEPLTLFVPDPNYKPDEEKLQKDFKKNRELVKQFEQFRKQNQANDKK